MKQGKARVRNPNNVFESVKEEESKRYKGKQTWGGRKRLFISLWTCLVDCNGNYIGI